MFQAENSKHKSIMADLKLNAFQELKGHFGQNTIVRRRNGLRQSYRNGRSSTEVTEKNNMIRFTFKMFTLVTAWRMN